ARSGTPSPETMDRLRAAVLRGERREGTAPVTSTRPQAALGEHHHPARFGIGSLINRMTGAADTAPVHPSVQAPRASAEHAAPEEERIEIPAFLRRQAN
ncbi:MAG: cell division protein FtsZ, partial [Jannaschia sp.]